MKEIWLVNVQWRDSRVLACQYFTHQAPPDLDEDETPEFAATWRRALFEREGPGTWTRKEVWLTWDLIQDVLFYD